MHPLALTFFPIMFSVYGWMFSACCSQNIVIDDFDDTTLEDVEADREVFTQFVINTHDWVLHENSAAAVNRVIDLHEELNIPVDIYVTSPLFLTYLEHHPDLIERFKTSDVVSTSYFVRTPYPYYTNFDWRGIADMNPGELRVALTEYETHAIDLETGYVTEEPGGYTHISDVLGYDPAITAISAADSVGRTLASLYQHFGAVMTTSHRNSPILPGDTKFDMLLRPEHSEIRLFENVGEDAQELIDGVVAEYSEDEDLFINLKYHEDDFYATDPPFGPIYWVDYNSGRRKLNGPPFDLDAWQDVDLLLSEEEADAYWQLYEDAVRYVAANPEHFTAINAFDLVDMLAEYLD